MRFKHYSLRTERTYREWIKRYILFHGKRHSRELGVLEVDRAQRPERLPTVLTREEAQRPLSGMNGTHPLMARLLYGTGMRLRVKDVDLGQNQIVVREGKGFKDRVTLLPERLKEPLAEHLYRTPQVTPREGTRPTSPCNPW